MILVDSNIVLDLVDNDPTWCAWSGSQMQRCVLLDRLAINAIVYAEISPRYRSQAEVEELLQELRLDMVDIPRSAAFIAGRAHMAYRQRGGARTGVLSDFFIGAHAAALGCPILTRDTSRYATYFPTVRLIAP